ncbi:putative late blight resistance protein homolog R1B-14 [Alnus glutinosa]|uniref:putative late blight resistance protein homolog R1B-14 n=1 Tax=Alnus glutinosa TaxID=3517 RepID=UPI002D79559B|nr:putative late blight resistance protein homolog R1B-14 [Alnus glutinosa]
MAEFVVDFRVEHLSQLLAEEANSFGGVEDQVKSLHRELRLINIFLKNSERKRSGHKMLGDDQFQSKQSKEDKINNRLKWRGHKMVENVIRKILDVAYEAEEVIDTIIFDVAVQTDKPKKIDNATHVRLLHDVAKKIEDLNKETNTIYGNIEMYGIERAEASVDAASEARYKRRIEVEEDDVVGFDYVSTTLVKQLTERNQQLDVVSIGGCSGSGKTTLARKIYNNVDIKSHFAFRAWVYLSNYDFSSREVLIEILKSVMSKSDELTRKKLFKYLSENELKKKLFKCLQGNRYLVVMDDFMNLASWDKLRSAFPDESNGSRIMMITSYTQMALFLHASLTPPYRLQVLNEDESWKLLSKKVFRGGTCPPELETPGRQLAKACKGLPLTIVLLAGIFVNNEKKYETLVEFNHVRRNPERIVRELCYLELPRHLKPCLLYFGVFPKGFEIPVRLLINLWVAERFIPYSRNIDPADVAEDYLEELIDRSLVQIVSRRTDGGAKTCRIHDLVKSLCIDQRCVADRFLDVVSNIFDSAKSCRVSLQSPSPNIPHFSLIPRSTPNVRSLLFFNQTTYGLDPKQWKWVHENFKLGRVLYFGYVSLYSVPTVITKLIHLRYLGIESDALKAIPHSIGNLINLETLNMKGTFLNCLPKEIWKLRRLRNLYVSGPVSLPNDLDPEVEVLGNLQVLSTVSLTPQSSLRIPNVRKLGLWFASDESNTEVVDAVKSLHHLHRLRTLKIINCSEYHCLRMSTLPLTITKITLRIVRLKIRRDMKVLGELPNLQILKLQSCLLSSKLHVFAGSFPQLQVLKLENLKIKKWKQRRGAMPCLKHLVIKQCNELTMLPSNRMNLTAVRDAEVLWSSSESAKMLQELQVKFGFNLLIYPPLTADLHEQTAT